MSGNTLGFLLSVIKLFEEANLPIWVFGGWAEELWQITPARTFEHLDRFVAQTKDFQVIQAKQFSHKRALLYQDLMIEFLLVQGAAGNYFTDFFSGRYRLVWPADKFLHRANISDYNVPIASKQALMMYRQRHEQIILAYQDFLNTN